MGQALFGKSFGKIYQKTATKTATKNGEITIFFSTKIQNSSRPLLTWFGPAWGRNNSCKPAQKEPLTVFFFSSLFYETKLEVEM